MVSVLSCLRKNLWHLYGNLPKFLVTAFGVAAYNVAFVSSDDSQGIIRVIVNN